RRRVVPGLLFFCCLQESAIFLCPGLIFLMARSCQSELGCAADEKLFTVAAAFNRPRDPCDPFLLCASNPLGGRAVWVAPSVASAQRGQRRAAPCSRVKMHGLSEARQSTVSSDA